MSPPTLFQIEPGPDPYNGTKHPARPVTPGPLGRGPAGETCGTCRHRVRLQYAKIYQKCQLMRHHWTSGPGSDIKAAWSACVKWESITEEGDPETCQM